MIKKLEQTINNYLHSFPQIKKVVKRAYQVGMYSVSKKVKYEGDIHKVSPDDGYEYFFGYYGISPWDGTDRYMLCLRAKDTTKSVAPCDPAEIILIDTHNNSWKTIATTNTWNVQQGCMVQWLGPDYKEKIIYNDFRNGQYVSIILNVRTKEEKVINMPIYSVSTDGKIAITLDYSRLHRLRKGYGYSNLEDEHANEKCPNETCLWQIDLENNNLIPLLKYTDLYNFETRESMVEAEHKVNHIMLNPSGNRFMVLHRWVVGSKKYTRLITANIDGTELVNLNDDNMTSHCYWKNDNEILAYAHKYKYGNGYFIMKDRSDVYEPVWTSLKSDGHPSYSPKGDCVVTDTYPDRKRLSKVYLLKGSEIKTIAKVYAPFKYDNDLRCDLHPRWNRKGDKVSIDATFEGKRALYTIKV